MQASKPLSTPGQMVWCVRLGDRFLNQRRGRFGIDAAVVEQNVEDEDFVHGECLVFAFLVEDEGGKFLGRLGTAQQDANAGVVAAGIIGCGVAVAELAEVITLDGP